MTPPENTPAIAYCRVSTEEQGDHGVSLDAQEHELRAYAESRGWQLTVVREVASGKSMRRRPVLHETLAGLRNGTYAVLMVTRLDRLHRNTVDAILTVVNRSEREGWLPCILDYGGERIDVTTANGKLLFTILAATAQHTRDKISEDTKRAMAQRKREGVHLGRPDAFHADKRPEERARAEVAVTRISYLRAKGLSIRAIADALNEEGVPSIRNGSWRAKNVHAVLHRYVKS